LLRRRDTQVGVMRVDWPEWRRIYPNFVRSPLLSLLAADGASVQPASDSFDSNRVPSAEELLNTSPDERKRLVVEYLGERVSRVLGLTKSELDVQRPLRTMGIDSLMAVEAKNRIEVDLRVIIPLVSILEGPTILQLADLVIDRLAQNLKSSVPVPREQGPNGHLSRNSLPDIIDSENASRLLDDIGELSDGDVDRLLGMLLTNEER
jgi:hypothetical protein